MNVVQDLAQYLERLLTPYVSAPRRDKKPGSMLSRDLLEYKLFV
jgi:hypothetical protein